MERKTVALLNLLKLLNKNSENYEHSGEITDFGLTWNQLLQSKAFWKEDLESVLKLAVTCKFVQDTSPLYIITPLGNLFLTELAPHWHVNKIIPFCETNTQTQCSVKFKVVSRGEKD